MMLNKTGFMVLYGLAIAGVANASVDLDRVCMLNGKGYQAGDVVVTQGDARLGAQGLACSMVNEQAMWLTLSDQAVDVVRQKEQEVDQSDSHAK